MNILVTLLFMAVIGALIGGLTNHIAIKMLFRPHEPKYIGSWRVPFTPGLIPRRRDELARQFGKTVVEYLLTPETFRKKLLTQDMKDKAQAFVQRQADQHIFHSDKTLAQWAALAGAPAAGTMIEKKVTLLFEQQFEALRLKVTTGTVEDVIPEAWLKEAEAKLPDITTYILERAGTYFSSPEGKKTFRHLIDDFLNSKGTLGGMIQMLFGESETLVSKVQNEALKFVAAPGTYHMLHSIIHGEFEKLRKRPVDELLGDFDWDGLFDAATNYILKELAIEKRLEGTLQDYWPEASEWFSLNAAPKVIDFAFVQAEKQMEESLRRLKIDEMVREQVDSFPVAKLEDLVLGISRREFKMITVLGALLGGMIGIVQGLIVFAMNQF